MELHEGDTFTFKVFARRNFESNPASAFFILEGPNGGKFMLPDEPYHAYGIEIGQKIRCRIDKISCSGKIYIEPENPFYMVGKTYLFSVLKIQRNILPNAEEAVVAFVLDKFGNTIEVIIDESVTANCSIACLVTRIKKGLLYLEFTGDKHFSYQFEENTWYDFLITGEYLHSNGDNNLILKSINNGTQHFIPIEDYKHYGLKVGQTISALVMRSSKKGNYYIEPKNPRYILGEKYLFEIVEISKFTRQEDNADIAIVSVVDLLQKKTSFIWKKCNLPTIGETIECKVVGFRKGKLVLQ